MFKNDNLRKACLEAVDILVNENQKQRTVGKDEAEYALIDTKPCTRTSVTLLYRFKGSRHIPVELEILSEPNCASISTTAIAVIASSVTLVITLVLVLVVCLCIWSMFSTL